MSSLKDLQSILFTSGSEYQVLRAEKLLPKVEPGELAYTILGALAQEEGANAVSDVIELAVEVTPWGRLNAIHLRAAIREKFAGTDKARQTMLQLGRLPWPDLSQRRA